MPPLRLAIFLASLAATGVAQSYVASPSIYEKCEGPSQNTFVGFSDPALQINLCHGELVHTDAALMALPVTTSPTGTATTPAVTVPFQLVYTVFTPTAQAASLDASQPLGLAVSNGIASIVPPLLPLVTIGRIYASGAPAATSGTLSKTSGLVTRFRC
jgi:hypothetical protein